MRRSSHGGFPNHFYMGYLTIVPRIRGTICSVTVCAHPQFNVCFYLLLAGAVYDETCMLIVLELLKHVAIHKIVLAVLDVLDLK